MSGGAPLLGTEVVMWIGAIGPLVATVHDRTVDEVDMRFHAPLATAVVNHFVNL